MADKIDTHLPQLVFFPHKDTSKDVRMMQHREQFGAEQNWVCPLSPILQIRRVPCHRRFSFPAVLTNCPWVFFTAALKRSIIFLFSLFQDQGGKFFEPNLKSRQLNNDNFTFSLLHWYYYTSTTTDTCRGPPSALRVSRAIKFIRQQPDWPWQVSFGRTFRSSLMGSNKSNRA